MHVGGAFVALLAAVSTCASSSSIRSRFGRSNVYSTNSRSVKTSSSISSIDYGSEPVSASGELRRQSPTDHETEDNPAARLSVAQRTAGQQAEQLPESQNPNADGKKAPKKDEKGKLRLMPANVVLFPVIEGFRQISDLFYSVLLNAIPLLRSNCFRVTPEYEPFMRRILTLKRGVEEYHNAVENVLGGFS